jgi:hypothetical protein
MKDRVSVEGGMAVLRRRFRLLDSGVELEVPYSLADLLDPYPADDPDLARDLHVVVSRSEASWAVTGAGTVRCRTSDLPGVLLAAVNSGVLARTRFLAVHAGVVSLNGMVVTFPGGSGAGKSTLTAACLRRGFSYLSDEALCLDPTDGVVQPFLRPLALDGRSWRLTAGIFEGPPRSGAEHVVAPEALGAQPAPGPQPLRHVVLLARGSDRLELAPAPRSDALAALLRHAFNHYRMPAQALDVVHRAVESACVWQLAYSDPLDAAELLARAVVTER